MFIYKSVVSAAAPALTYSIREEFIARLDTALVTAAASFVLYQRNVLLQLCEEFAD